MTYRDNYELGAALVILALVIIPAGLLKLPELRLRHPMLLWGIGWVVGLASVFGRRP